MARFYSPTPQELLPNVTWLPQDGASAGPSGRPPNSYALITDRGAVFIDAVFSWTLGGIAEVVDDHPPIAFLLTHSDVADQADALETLRRQYGTPIYLHPDDAADPRTHDKGASFQNPREDEYLAGAGLDIIAMPYHTPGSLMFYVYGEGGTLFTGDSAVAPGPRQNPEPARLERPLTDPERDRAMAEDWRAVLAGRVISNVLPLHGTPYLRQADIAALAGPLVDGSPMNPGEPAEGPDDLTAHGVPPG